MQRKLYKYLLLCCIIFTGCQTYRTETMFEGDWPEYTGIQIDGGNFVKLSFHDNKFVYYYEEWGDMITHCDKNTNPPTGFAKETAEGDFVIDKDVITLNGRWLDKSCYNKGEFKARYRFKILPVYFNSSKIRLELVGSESSSPRGIREELLIIKK